MKHRCWDRLVQGVEIGRSFIYLILPRTDTEVYFRIPYLTLRDTVTQQIHVDTYPSQRIHS